VPEGLDALDDEELVRLVRGGDRQAAAVLFARHDRLLQARAKRFVGGLSRKVGPSDVLQETYLAAFRGLDGFEDQGPGSFRRWLEAIADHKAADQAKRHLRAGRSVRREVSPDPSAMPLEPAGNQPSPSMAAARAEDDAALLRALDSLEDDDRTVLRLVGQEGRDYAATGEAMGRSPEAVRKLYGRAVLRLGRAMKRTS
jgi:RNA polymerase sigma-70 factor (ECF subfamily)